MKILLLCPELFASDGGIQRITRLYLRALAALPETAEVRVVAYNDRTLPAARLRETLGDRVGAAVGCGGNKLRFVRAAWRLSAGADRIICTHVRQLPVAALVRVVRRNLRIYLVAHGIEVWRPFSAMENWALHRTARIWCVSDFTRREIILRVPDLGDRLSVVPNALDPEFAVTPPAHRREGGGRIILSVGRLSHADAYKGYDLLIRALPQIRQAAPGTQLRLVGSGDDEARLRALAAENDVTGAVVFAGRVTDEQLRAEFARCDLFALPSTGEGFGLAFIEALAAGKPCVGADAGATPEIIDASCGLLVPPGDVPGLATACTAALGRDWAAETLRHRAQRYSFAAFQARLAAAW